MYKTILCALDGSDHAARAVTLAVDLCERYGAKLVLVHALARHMSTDQLGRFASHAHLKDIVEPEIERIEAQLVASAGPHPVTYVPPPSPQVVIRIGEVLLEDARLEAEARGVGEVEMHLDEGDPAQRILERARTHGADMIVMGSRGLGALKGLLLGSVSQKVAHLAPCTCVTVK